MNAIQTIDKIEQNYDKILNLLGFDVVENQKLIQNFIKEYLVENKISVEMLNEAEVEKLVRKIITQFKLDGAGIDKVGLSELVKDYLINDFKLMEVVKEASENSAASYIYNKDFVTNEVLNQKGFLDETKVNELIDQAIKDLNLNGGNIDEAKVKELINQVIKDLNLNGVDEITLKNLVDEAVKKLDLGEVNKELIQEAFKTYGLTIENFNKANYQVSNYIKKLSLNNFANVQYTDFYSDEQDYIKRMPKPHFENDTLIATQEFKLYRGVKNAWLEAYGDKFSEFDNYKDKRRLGDVLGYYELKDINTGEYSDNWRWFEVEAVLEHQQYMMIFEDSFKGDVDLYEMLSKLSIADEFFCKIVNNNYVPGLNSIAKDPGDISIFNHSKLEDNKVINYSVCYLYARVKEKDTGNIVVRWINGANSVWPDNDGYFENFNPLYEENEIPKNADGTHNLQEGDTFRVNGKFGFYFKRTLKYTFKNPPSNEPPYIWKCNDKEKMKELENKIKELESKINKA